MIYFALVVSLVLNACFAAIVLKLSLSGFDALSESHERTTAYTEGLVDRLMAGDYATYHDRKLAEEMMLDSTGAPADLDEATSLFTSGPDKGGFGSRLGLAAVPLDPEADYEAADLADRERDS